VNKNIPKKSVPSNKEVKEEFTGKNLTRFGGTGLIRRYLKRIGINCYLEEIRVKKDRGYPPQQMFLSTLYGILLGLSRPYHMMELVRDKVFQRIAGLKGFPTQSTISRFFQRLTVGISREVYQINYSLLLKVRKGFRDFIDGITADLDSHVNTVYGRQQRAKAGFNPKKRGRKSYHPILCFIGETRDFLAGTLRSGKHHTSYNARGFLSSIIKALPVGIKRLRADSGFFSIEFIQWLKEKGIEFFIAVPLQQWVQKIILYQGSWESVGRGISAKEIPFPLGKKGFCRLVHNLGSMSRVGFLRHYFERQKARGKPCASHYAQFTIYQITLGCRHIIPLPNGTVTPGSQNTLAQLPLIYLPEDLSGKTVLDI